MFRKARSQYLQERGFTLVEMIIASAIFAIAAAVAFILYGAAQRSYKAGQNFTDQQQNTRAAFDRVLSDLRNAGYNYNPDGSKSRGDEQIEAAYDTAIVLRADLDFEDPALSLAPEGSIKGVYNVVSTGNDEVVAYVLASPPGPAAPRWPSRPTSTTPPGPPSPISGTTSAWGLGTGSPSRSAWGMSPWSRMIPPTPSTG